MAVIKWPYLIQWLPLLKSKEVRRLTWVLNSGMEDHQSNQPIPTDAIDSELILLKNTSKKAKSSLVRKAGYVRLPYFDDDPSLPKIVKDKKKPVTLRLDEYLPIPQHRMLNRQHYSQNSVLDGDSLLAAEAGVGGIENTLVFWDQLFTERGQDG